jgi:hypothetical protein
LIADIEYPLSLFAPEIDPRSASPIYAHGKVARGYCMGTGISAGVLVVRQSDAIGAALAAISIGSHVRHDCVIVFDKARRREASTRAQRQQLEREDDRLGWIPSRPPIGFIIVAREDVHEQTLG